MKKFLSMFLCLAVLLSCCAVTVSAARYEYTVNGIAFTDNAGVEYSEVPYGTNVNVDVSVTTNYAVEGAKLVLASYDFDNTLCQLKTFDITADEGETEVLSTKMLSAYDRYVKAFALVSLTNPYPVSNYYDKGFTFGFKEFRTEDIYDNKTDIDRVAVYNENGRYDYYYLDISELYINGSDILSKDIRTEYGTLYAGERISPYNMSAILEYYLSSERTADIRIGGEFENYTTMHITEYQSYVVMEKNSNRSYIVSRENIKVVFDDYYDFKIIKNGAEIEFDDICVDDVLSIAGYINEDKELEFGTVIVNSNTVTGVVGSCSTGSKEITIDNVTYIYDENKLYPMEYLGANVIARFDARGTVVAIDEYTEPDSGDTETELSYAFATAAAKKTGGTDGYQIRLMDKTGKWQVLDFADIVSFNGGAEIYVSSLTPAGIATMVGNMGIDGQQSTIEGAKIYINKVIAYTTNSDGEINTVYFQDGSDKYSTRIMIYPEYNEASGKLGSVYLDSDTLIFSANDNADSGTVDEDDVKVASKTALKDMEMYEVVMAVNVNASGYAEAIFGYYLIDESYSETATVTGRVTSYDTDEKTIIIDNVEYIYDENNVSPGQYLGAKVVATLDFQGIIVGLVEYVEPELNYAFSTVIRKNTGLAYGYNIRLMDSTGTWQTLDFADIVSFNGGVEIYAGSMTPSGFAMYVGNIGLGNQASFVEGANIYVNKVIAYTTDSDGKINTVYFQGESDKYNTRILSMPMYDASTGMFGSVNIDSDTVIFSVNSYSGNIYIAEDEVEAGGKMSLRNREMYENAMAVNISANGYAEAIFGYNLIDENYTSKEFRTEDIYDNKTDIYRVAVYNENDRYDYYDLDITNLYINGLDTLSKDIPTYNGTLYAGERISQYNIGAILEYYLSSERTADIRIEGEFENYTTMHITEYQTYVVSEINSSRSYIISRENQRIIFDDYYYFKIIKDGEEIEFDDICVDDVLSIAGYINSQKELEFGTVIVNSDTVVGRVTMYDHDWNVIAIDNVTYRYDANKIYPVGLLGTNVIARFDARGTIAALDEYTGSVEPDDGGGDEEQEILDNAIFTVSSMLLTSNAGVEGKLIKGLQNGAEAEVFVAYDVGIVKADFTLSDFRNSTISGDIAKGDVLLFGNDSDGNLSKVIIVMDASDYAGNDELENSNSYTTLGTCNEDGEEYTYAIGFILDADSDYIKLMPGTPEWGDIINNSAYTTYNLAGFSNIVSYDAYYTTGAKRGKTETATLSDVEPIYTYFESYQGNTTERIDMVGDMAFLRINEGTDKVEMVILKNYY